MSLCIEYGGKQYLPVTKPLHDVLQYMRVPDREQALDRCYLHQSTEMGAHGHYLTKNFRIKFSNMALPKATHQAVSGVGPAYTDVVV